MQAADGGAPVQVPPWRLPIWYANHRRSHVSAWMDYEQRVVQAQQRLHRGVPALSGFWDEQSEALVRAVEMPPRYRSRAQDVYSGDSDDDDEDERYTLGTLADFMGFGRAKQVLEALVDELWTHSVWRRVVDIPAALLCVGECREMSPDKRVVNAQLARGLWEVEFDGQRHSWVRTWAHVEMRRSAKYPWVRVMAVADRDLGRAYDYWHPDPAPQNSATDRVVASKYTPLVNFGAHRLMCLAAHGPPPPDAGCVVAAHACDNKKCFNPAHLRWLTQSVNCMEHGGSEARSARARSQHRVGGRFARPVVLQSDSGTVQSETVVSGGVDSEAVGSDSTVVGY